MDEVRGHDEELLLGESGDRQVGGDSAGGVEPLGVDQPTDLTVDDADREPVEYLRRIGTLDEELRHQAHIEDADVLTHGTVFAAHDVETRLPGEVERGRRMFAVGVVPLGELPPHGGVEVPTGGHQSVVQHRTSHIARRTRFPGGPDRITEQHAELLDGAFGAEAPGGLMRGSPVDGISGDVHRWEAIDNPVRHQVSDATSHQDAQRVHPGRDEVAIQFRCRAEHRPDVGREGFRTAEEQPHSDFRQRGNALQCRTQVRAQAVPVRRHGAEGEAVRDTVE